MPTAKPGPWLDAAIARGLLTGVTVAPTLPANPSEKLFQSKVVELAEGNGWLVFHPFDSRRSEPGYPDLTMVRAGVLIFAELKTDTGHVSLPQADWHTRLGEVEGVRVRLWRPSMWPAIVAELA